VIRYSLLTIAVSGLVLACTSTPAAEKPVAGAVAVKPAFRTVAADPADASNSADTKAIRMAITMDDLPEYDDAMPHENRLALAKTILKTFKAHGVPEVYGFTNGFWLEGKQSRLSQVLEAWTAAGYPLGNHTYDHPDLDDPAVTVQQYVDAIVKNEVILKKYSSAFDWKVFRYPFLHEGTDPQKKLAVRKQLQALGYRVAEVTTDFADWDLSDAYTRCLKKNDTQGVANVKSRYAKDSMASVDHASALSKAIFGRQIPQILLLHIGTINEEMLGSMLDGLKKRGVVFITVKEALSDPAYLDLSAPPYAGNGTYFDQILESRHQEPSSLGIPDITGPGDEPAISDFCSH
jgi:peptidoglycan/xylan/chitin deacetylase (PgdA/CDA1 family)